MTPVCTAAMPACARSQCMAVRAADRGRRRRAGHGQGAHAVVSVRALLRAPRRPGQRARHLREGHAGARCAGLAAQRVPCTAQERAPGRGARGRARARSERGRARARRWPSATWTTWRRCGASGRRWSCGASSSAARWTSCAARPPRPSCTRAARRGARPRLARAGAAPGNACCARGRGRMRLHTAQCGERPAPPCGRQQAPAAGG